MRVFFYLLQHVKFFPLLIHIVLLMLLHIIMLIISTVYYTTYSKTAILCSSIRG